MKAHVLKSGRPHLTEMPRPEPGPDEVLVRVRAAALNRADLAIAAGAQHGDVGGEGALLGLEWSGEVVATGDKVTTVVPGDRVMCTGRGGFAEYAVTDWGRVQRIGELGWVQAAALPIALMTMHDAFVTRGRIAPGHSVLVQGASTAVGLMALQLARYLGAGFVAGSSTSDWKRDRLSGFGADLVIDPRDPDWPIQVTNATDGAGVDLIIDQIGAGQGVANMRAIAIGGTVVNVGRMGGAVGPFDFETQALKQVTSIGVTFRTRTVRQVREITSKMQGDLNGAVLSGEIAMPIDRSFCFDELLAAYDYLGRNRQFGKVLVELPG